MVAEEMDNAITEHVYVQMDFQELTAVIKIAQIIVVTLLMKLKVNVINLQEFAIVIIHGLALIAQSNHVIEIVQIMELV